MIKDFKKSKEQLKELAEVLNDFKSEAVQVKLVELLFGNSMETETAAAETKPRRPGRPPKEKTAERKVTKRRVSNRPGPSVILNTLVDKNYFSDKRTIGDVVDYCMKMYNYEYKSTDLSGTLAKLAKEGVLKREKNPETNQFEYMNA
ncbi:MAG: hypothetical protein ACLFPE_10900 [Bacteroidales bacterium]